MSTPFNKNFSALLMSLLLVTLGISASNAEEGVASEEMIGKQNSSAINASTPVISSPSRTEDFTRFVNPMFGASGHGHVFVGASTPFGNVQLGSTNIYKDWCSGYHYCDSIVIGFFHNHHSRTGCSDLGYVGIMPYTVLCILC